MVNALAPVASPEALESSAFVSLIAEFDETDQDHRKVEYLKHRYAGFTKKEASTLIGVNTGTVTRWANDDSRLEKYEREIGTMGRREIRKDVIQEEWYRNFYLVMKKDEQVLKKAHGMLDEPYLEMDVTTGELKRKTGSPPMTKDDWKYFSQMRKMYSPEAWASIEKVVTGGSGDFNISEFVLNIAQNQQFVNGQA